MQVIKIQLPLLSYVKFCAKMVSLPFLKVIFVTLLLALYSNAVECPGVTFQASRAASILMLPNIMFYFFVMKYTTPAAASAINSHFAPLPPLLDAAPSA